MDGFTSGYWNQITCGFTLFGGPQAFKYLPIKPKQELFLDGWMDGQVDLLVDTGVATTIRIVQWPWPKPLIVEKKNGEGKYFETEISFFVEKKYN